MKIWIITIGEPIIHKHNALRIHRSGLLAKYISENTSHEVVWWTSLYNHFTNKYNSTIITNKSNHRGKNTNRNDHKEEESPGRGFTIVDNRLQITLVFIFFLKKGRMHVLYSTEQAAVC